MLEEHPKTNIGGWVPRSSAEDMLRHETVPKAELLRAFTAVLGLSKEEQDKQEAASCCLAEHHGVRFVPAEAIDSDLDEFTSFILDADDHDEAAT